MITIATLFCLAYILGLLLTGISGTIAGIPLGAIVMLITGVTLAFSIRRIWRSAPRAWVWLASGLVGVAAVLYFQLRLPQPNPTDICHLVWQEAAQVGQINPDAQCQPSSLAKAEARLFQVKGEVLSPPRLTRNGRLQFELAATQISGSTRTQATVLQPQATTGKVYVTVPLSAGEQIYPGLMVQIEGSLYKPKPASNPGGFDFEKYLAQQGIFAGLNGNRLEYPTGNKPAPPLFWKMRQQIVQIQEHGLGQPEGALVSAIVMGKTAVNVPFNIQDQFRQTGLAHALAASGTQVSLLIGIILKLTKRLPSKLQFGLGAGTIIAYIGLTGIEPSVARAGVMGGITLLALTVNRKVKPLGALLFAAVGLLLLNPLWIFDLGFQLSFLATLGLLVTVPILTKWLDWMPSAITPMFTIPIAAYIWTLPLLLSIFGVVSLYSILINVLVSPLITLISIGGMISAAAALIYPMAGSFLASWLYYPTNLFIKIAEIGSQLPGNTFAVGTINAVQVCLLYGLIGLVWQWKRLHRYWWIAGLVGIGLVAIPVGYAAANLSQVTVLATAEKPVLIVQDRGKIGLIHSGNAQDAEFTILPFLQKQGVNRLDWAIASNLQAAEIEGWQQILTAQPIDLFYSSFSPSPNSNSAQTKASANLADSSQAYNTLRRQVQSQQGVALPLTNSPKIQFGSTTLEHPFSKPDVWLLRIGNQTWLWFDGVPALQRQTDLMQQLQQVEVVGWSGKAMHPKLLEKIQPKMAVVFGKFIDPETEQWLQQQHVQIHWIKQGALQWTAKGGAKSLGLSD